MISLNDRLSADRHTNKIFFSEPFNPQDDLYVSFEAIKLPTTFFEAESLDQFVLTQNNSNIDFYEEIPFNTGFSVFLVTSLSTYNSDMQPGVGLGVLADPLLSGGNLFLQDHLLSITFDYYGQFSNLSKNLTSFSSSLSSKKTNNLVFLKDSNFTFLYEKQTNDILLSNTKSKKFRIRFKEFLDFISVEYKDELDEDYKTISDIRTNIDLDNLPDQVYVGFSHSGIIPMGIKDITYSGVSVNNSTSL